MKYVLVTVALVLSTSAFGAVDASPPTELPGCELVGTVKNVKIWAVSVSQSFEMECR